MNVILQAKPIILTQVLPRAQRNPSREGKLFLFKKAINLTLQIICYSQGSRLVLQNLIITGS